MERIRKIYKKTVCQVKKEEESNEIFWITKGLRQGVHSSTLFSLYICEMWRNRETMEKQQVERTVIQKNLVGRLRHCTNGKKYKRNEENKMTRKIAVQEKSHAECGEDVNLGKQEVEKGKFFGYMIKKNSKNGKHIEDRTKKPRNVIRQVWSTGVVNF